MPTRPLMLLFSGMQQLKEFILREEQLRYLVRTVTFNEIDPLCEEELNKLRLRRSRQRKSFGDQQLRFSPTPILFLR